MVVISKLMIISAELHWCVSGENATTNGRSGQSPTWIWRRMAATLILYEIPMGRRKYQ